MIGEAAKLAQDIDLADNFKVRELKLGDPTLETDLEQVCQLLFQVFDDKHMKIDHLRQQLHEQQLWVAQIRNPNENTAATSELDGDSGGSIVGFGKLKVVPNTQFAGLWGGCVAKQWRGKQIYRALTAARAKVALTVGVQYLQSDCTVMSRPILQRSGLHPVSTTTPYLLPLR